MDTLNFLKFQPLTNWLDYFLDRDKFLDLVADAEKNESTIGQLLDQFVEQALNSERELVQLELKEMDEDDIIYMRHKVDELWMCAMSCFAALCWELSFLTQCSNVSRIRGLLNKLCRWVFGEELYQQNVNEDFFGRISASNDISSFNSEQIFSLWLYARWILIVDINARFPVPAAKPTVSNPQNQVDQSLVQAEKLNQITAEVRHNVPAAVKLLNQFLGVLNGNALKTYGRECFHVEPKTILHQSLALLRCTPKPDFQFKCFGMDRSAFQTKTMYSLFVAHFAARHFRTAKELLNKIKKSVGHFDEKWNNMLPFLQKLLKIDKSQIKAYDSALNFTNNSTEIPLVKSKTLRLSSDEKHAKSLVEAAVSRRNPTPKALLNVLMNGSCVSKRFLLFLTDENFRTQFLEEVSKQFWSLSVVAGSRDRENKKRLHIYCVLYFFCLISPDFSNSLLSHPRLNNIRKWRGLATTIETPVDATPKNDELTGLICNDTPLWNVLTSFDLELIISSLNQLGNGFRLPFRHKFSEVIGESILNNTERIYNQVVVYLWKLEQLVSLNYSAKWKTFINAFGTRVMGSALTSEIQEMMAFDLIRAETDILNRQLFKVENLNEYTLRNSVQFNVLNGSMQMVIQRNNLAFTKFALPLSIFLLNNRHYKLIGLTEHFCFKSPFTDLARILAFYFIQAFENRARAQNALTTFWTTMWPTFDGSNRRQGPILLSKQQFLDFIADLKEPNVLDFLFSYCAFLLNSTLGLAAEDGDKPQQPPPTPLAAALTTSRRICAQNENIWQQIGSEEHLKSLNLDVDYTKTVLEILCRNAMVVNSINVHWLRILGDFNFVTEKYREAITYYLEIVMVTQQRLGNVGLNDFEMDHIFTKISLALVALQMPTLAVIVGQLRTNLTSHYPQVEWMLQFTPNTVDAGYAYFPLIADIVLVEYMAAAYNKFSLTIYAQKLMKNMPTKAINVNNTPKVLNCEVERRKKRFFEILLNQFFRQNV